MNDHAAVTHHGPLRWRGDTGADLCLEVGLVETGENLLRVDDTDVGADVGLAVLGIDVAVEAVTGARVRDVSVDDKGVVERETCQRNPTVGPRALRQGYAVERGRVHALGGELREGVGTRLDAEESHRHAGPRNLVTARQVEVDVVRRHVEQTGALARLVPGERRGT